MELKDVISKLKKIVFIKKSIGEPYKNEESALKALEERMIQEEAEFQALEEEIRKKQKLLQEAEGAIPALKEKVIRAALAWQEAAKELFRHERETEDIFDSIIPLYRQAGVKNFLASWPKGKSIYIGSQRARWIEDDLDPLTEEFRRELIQDNRDWFTNTKKRPEPRRLKVKSGVKFNPFQVMALLANGMQVPKWMDEEYRKYLKKNPQFPIV